MKTVFLGMNEAGEDVLEWLEEREEIEVIGVFEDEQAFDFIKEERPELVVSSGFEHIVPKEVIEVPEKGIVNLHPSYLPYNRGAHPYIWPFIDDTPAGVSIHFMDERIDEGPLIAREEVEIRPEDDAKSLRNRLMERHAEIFKENWGRIVEGEAFEQPPGTSHKSDELDELSRLDLKEEMALEDFLDLLRGLTYGEEGLATFEKGGETFNVKIEINRQDS